MLHVRFSYSHFSQIVYIAQIQAKNGEVKIVDFLAILLFRRCILQRQAFIEDLQLYFRRRYIYDDAVSSK